MIARVARPYAEALLRAARTTESALATRQELGRFAELLAGNPALGRAFASPGVALDAKRRVFDQVAAGAAVGPLAKSFLALLLANHRLARLPEMLEAFDSLLNRRLGVVEAEVTTAEPLAGEQSGRLAAALGKLVGAQVKLRLRVDPALVGGFVARVESARFDASVRGQLDRLARRLAAGGN